MITKIVQECTDQLTVQYEFLTFGWGPRCSAEDTRGTGSSWTPCFSCAASAVLNAGVRKELIALGRKGMYCLALALELWAWTGDENLLLPKQPPERNSPRETGWSTSSSLPPTEKLTPSLIWSTSSIPCGLPDEILPVHKWDESEELTRGIDICVRFAIKIVQSAMAAFHLKDSIAIPGLVFPILGGSPWKSSNWDAYSMRTWGIRTTVPSNIAPPLRHCYHLSPSLLSCLHQRHYWEQLACAVLDYCHEHLTCVLLVLETLAFGVSVCMRERRSVTWVLDLGKTRRVA